MKKNFMESLISDREGRKLYFREDLIFEVTEAICRVMEQKEISKAELSKLAGVSKSNITQLLSGDHNMQLTTVADLLFALDCKLEVSPAPLDVESIIQSARNVSHNQWVPSEDFSLKQGGYEGIDNKEDHQLTQAA